MKMVAAMEFYYQEVYELYRELVGISSQSANKSGVDRVGDKIAEFMRQRDFCVEKCMNPEAGNGVLISVNPNGHGKRIVLLAHMDTVHKEGTFAEPLFREEGDKIYGPGVLDCKGGIAVGLLTMLALRDCGYQAPVKFILAPDEEINLSKSGQKGIDFIKDNVQDADYVMVLESGTRNKLVTGRKGVVRYEVSVHGKAAHAGCAYDKGISAIREACSKIQELEKNSDSHGITYNCGLISGGVMPNSVPDFCKFVVDVRFFNQRQQKEAIETVERIVETTFLEGTRSEMRLLSKREAMEETEGNKELFRIIQTVAKRLQLEELESFVSGGASDACFSSAMGIPTVCGMGIIGQFQHTTSEEADISSIKTRSILLGKTIEEINEVIL